MVPLQFVNMEITVMDTRLTRRQKAVTCLEMILIVG